MTQLHTTRRPRNKKLSGAITTMLMTTLLSICSLPGQAASMSLQITGITEHKGHVMVALYNSAKSYTNSDHIPGSYYALLVLPADNDAKTVILPDAPAGRYAAVAFHDENDNLELDKTFMGKRQESMAVSSSNGDVEGLSFEHIAFTHQENHDSHQILKLVPVTE